MLRRLGYACLCVSLSDTSPRGTILRRASEERLRELIEVNLSRLEAVLRFNIAREIRLFRLSSELIPFGSHPINRIEWWKEFSGTLDSLGALIRSNDMRVSFHPGQYTLLSAMDPSIVEASVRDLVYHARFLDCLQLPPSHKIVTHVGGAYGDRESALERWASNVRSLPESVRARLVLENDERLFGVEDVLRASEKTGVPVVFDVLHHRVYSGSDDSTYESLCRAASTWRPERDGVPKIHYSSQAEGQKPGAHAEYIGAEEFEAFLSKVRPELTFDCMLEAKAKDKALFTLRQALKLAA